jgi:hypothetical protein
LTVWTVHPLRDEHSANMAEFGTLRAVNQRFIFPDELEPDGSLPAAFIHHMEAAAKRFDPNTDYLVLSGDQLQVTALAAILAHHHGWFTVLKYERREAAYFPATIKSYHLAQQAPPVVENKPQTGVKNGEDSKNGGGEAYYPRKDFHGPDT